MRLEESEMFVEERKTIQEHVSAVIVEEAAISWAIRKNYILFYWPRQFVASFAWIANDFAFYGNKLQQSRFIDLLHPGATAFVKMEWTVLNSFISLLGYYTAAFMMDVPWY
jgi:hypothetical protein